MKNESQMSEQTARSGVHIFESGTQPAQPMNMTNAFEKKRRSETYDIAQEYKTKEVTSALLPGEDSDSKPQKNSMERKSKGRANTTLKRPSTPEKALLLPTNKATRRAPVQDKDDTRDMMAVAEMEEPVSSTPGIAVPPDNSRQHPDYPNYQQQQQYSPPGGHMMPPPYGMPYAPYGAPPMYAANYGYPPMMAPQGYPMTQFQPPQYAIGPDGQLKLVS